MEKSLHFAHFSCKTCMQDGPAVFCCAGRPVSEEGHTMRRTRIVIAFLLLFALLLSSCGQAAPEGSDAEDMEMEIPDFRDLPAVPDAPQEGAVTPVRVENTFFDRSGSPFSLVHDGIDTLDACGSESCLLKRRDAADRRSVRRAHRILQHAGVFSRHLLQLRAAEHGL